MPTCAGARRDTLRQTATKKGGPARPTFEKPFGSIYCFASEDGGDFASA